MELEIKMASEQQLKHELPVREEPPTERVTMEITSRRRLLRVEIADLLRTLNSGEDLPGFSIRLCRVAFAVAGTCAQFGSRPDFGNYAEAATAAFDDAGRELDRALQVSDWHGIKIATAKLQLLWMGCAANLGLPYGAMMSYLHERYLAGSEIEPEKVNEMLKAAGLSVAAVELPPPANDGPKLKVVETGEEQP